MDNYGEIIIYQTEDGLTKINVNMQNETVWLSLEQMADLFQRDKSTISRHIKNTFDEGELVRESTVAKFATVQNEGNRQIERVIEYYNLDVIISVGYRVKSQRGVQFRIWAASILKEYIKKGFAMDDERLKRCFTVRYSKSMQPVLITTPRQRYPFNFLRKYRIKFIMPFPEKLQLRYFTIVRMQKKILWG